MGESLVIIAPDQQITNDDLNNIGTNAQSSLDHVVEDGISSQKKFTGFSIVQSGPAQITVGAGRLYNAGKVYARNDQGGVAIDLITILPTAVRKIVTIVAWGQEVETAVEARTFLIDPDTEATESRPTATEIRRFANIDRVSGQEATEPAPPALDANVLAIADVVLTPSGIESITRRVANVLPSVQDNDNRLRTQEEWRGRAGARLDVLDTSIAGIQSRIGSLPTNEFVYEIARDVGRLKELAELPETYTSYDADRFLTKDKSDTANVGFLAKVEEGIRFPPASQRVAQLLLANPIDPSVHASNNFILPAFTEIERVKMDGKDGELSLSQYQYQTVQTVQRTRTRTRIRFGASQTVCTNSAWWKQGTYDPTSGVLRRTGETWEVENDPGAYGGGFTAIEAHGLTHFVRVTQFWKDTYQVPYWEHITVTEGVNGSIVAETFLNSEAGFITAIGVPFTRVAATGDVTVLIVNTDVGKPVIDDAIARVTVPAASLKTYPTKTKIQIPPTYLEKGKRYGIVFITAGNHFIATVTGNKNTNGSLFHSTDGAWFQGDLLKDIPFSLYYAQWASPRAEIQLQPLQLENGIVEIDINADTTVPDGTELSFEVQLDGVWHPLKPYNETLIIGLPPLIPLRVVLLGTTDVMPGFGIAANSEVITERPRSDFRHITTERVLPAPCDTIEVTQRLEYWDDTRHTATCVLLTGAGFATVETADTVVDMPTPDPNAIVRRWTFNLAAPISSYKIRTEGTTDNVLVVFHVAERYDLAFS